MLSSTVRLYSAWNRGDRRSRSGEIDLVKSRWSQITECRNRCGETCYKVNGNRYATQHKVCWVAPYGPTQHSIPSVKRLDFVDPLLKFSINLRVNREIYVVKRGVLRHIASSLKSEQIRDLPPRGADCARVRARRQNYVFVPESDRRNDMS